MSLEHRTQFLSKYKYDGGDNDCFGDCLPACLLHPCRGHPQFEACEGWKWYNETFCCIKAIKCKLWTTLKWVYNVEIEWYNLMFFSLRNICWSKHLSEYKEMMDILYQANIVVQCLLIGPLYLSASLDWWRNEEIKGDSKPPLLFLYYHLNTRFSEFSWPDGSTATSS